jgi:hypothetical protein
VGIHRIFVVTGMNGEGGKAFVLMGHCVEGGLERLREVK